MWRGVSWVSHITSRSLMGAGNVAIMLWSCFWDGITVCGRLSGLAHTCLKTGILGTRREYIWIILLHCFDFPKWLAGCCTVVLIWPPLWELNSRDRRVILSFNFRVTPYLLDIFSVCSLRPLTHLRSSSSSSSPSRLSKFFAIKGGPEWQKKETRTYLPLSFLGPTLAPLLVSSASLVRGRQGNNGWTISTAWILSCNSVTINKSISSSKPGNSKWN